MSAERLQSLREPVHGAEEAVQISVKTAAGAVYILPHGVQRVESLGGAGEIGLHTVQRVEQLIHRRVHLVPGILRILLGFPEILQVSEPSRSIDRAHHKGHALILKLLCADGECIFLFLPGQPEEGGDPDISEGLDLRVRCLQ